MSSDKLPMRGAAGVETQPLPVLDAAALAGLRELDPTGKNHLMERVFAAFQESASRLMPQLIESHRVADANGMRYVAHTLKSSSASVGGVMVAGLCASLESQLRLGEPADLQAQVDTLQREMQRLLLAIQHHDIRSAP